MKCVVLILLFILGTPVYAAYEEFTDLDCVAAFEKVSSTKYEVVWFDTRSPFISAIDCESNAAETGVYIGDTQKLSSVPNKPSNDELLTVPFGLRFYGDEDDPAYEMYYDVSLSDIIVLSAAETTSDSSEEENDTVGTEDERLPLYEQVIALALQVIVLLQAQLTK